MTVAYSRHPARVTTSDGTEVNRSAVVVRDGRALLAVLGPHQHHEAGGVKIIAELDEVTVEPQHRRKVLLRAADGQVWTVETGDGCGCRNALSVWYGQQIRGEGMGS